MRRFKAYSVLGSQIHRYLLNFPTVPNVGKPDFHVSEHRKPFNLNLFAAKTNQLLSQNPRQLVSGSVVWGLKENPMFKATFHLKSLFPLCEHRGLKWRDSASTVGMSFGRIRTTPPLVALVRKQRISSR